ncbi:hypothetical protein KSS87_012220 [Heliosperma pusillum]|nr:hypothetical protein KSS87_012220 [Heliosperma pusillum]
MKSHSVRHGVIQYHRKTEINIVVSYVSVYRTCAFHECVSSSICGLRLVFLYNVCLSNIVNSVDCDLLFLVLQTLLDCSDALRPFQENVNKNAKASSKKPGQPSDSEKLKEDFESKMSDDLHIADILKGSLQEALKSINNELNGLKKKQKQQKLLAVQSLTELEAAIRDVLEVLGLLSPAPYTEVLHQLKEKALLRAEMTEDDVSHMIEERAMARKNKDFSMSDQIRSQLTAKGISLMDLPTGTTWRPCVPEGKDEISSEAAQ